MQILAASRWRGKKLINNDHWNNLKENKNSSIVLVPSGPAPGGANSLDISSMKKYKLSFERKYLWTFFW